MTSLKMSNMDDLSSHFRRTAGAFLSVYPPNLPFYKVSKFGSVSKVEIVTPMALIYKVLFPSISTFETPPIRYLHFQNTTLSSIPACHQPGTANQLRVR